MIDLSTFTLRRPRIDYGPTLAQSWTAEMSARMWLEEPRSVGARRISAGGYGASHVLRNDVLLRCRFRIRESDWPTFYRAIQWGHLQERVTFYPDASDTDTFFSVYVDAPSAGTPIRPERSSEYPRGFEFAVTFRLADSEESFGLQYLDALTGGLTATNTTGGDGGLSFLPLVVGDPGAIVGAGAVADGEPSAAGSGSSGASGDSTPPGGPVSPTEPDDPYTPDPSAPNNEPPGFLQVFNKPHDSFTEYDIVSGRIAASSGDFVFTFPTGASGGTSGFGTEIGVGPGRAVIETTNYGPYAYFRFEGILLSEDWQGHASSVNKLWFHRLRGHASGATCPFIARGSNESPLYPSMASQGWNMVSIYGDQVAFTWEGCSPLTGPGGVVWNDLFPNYASPTSAQAEMTRGERHTVEELFYVGTPGNADGWFKTWLNGVLVMDYRALPIVEPGDPRVFYGINIDPVWGGTGDTIESTQTLSIARFYASEGSSV